MSQWCKIVESILEENKKEKLKDWLRHTTTPEYIYHIFHLDKDLTEDKNETTNSLWLGGRILMENKYIEEFRKSCKKLEEAEDYLYSNDDITALKKENEDLKRELEEYKQVNKYLQNDKEYAKQAYINRLSNAIKTNYEDYKKYVQLADKEQMEILIDNLYDTLRANGIKLD